MGDVRYALRRLRRSPGFTLVAIVVLAVGIGVNTSVFTFANGLLLKRLPAPEPDRLVRVHSFTFSSTPYPEFLLYREQTTKLESLVATRELMLSLRVGDGVAEPVFGELVSDDFFELLRVSMAEGRRWRGATDDQPGEAGIVLSHRFWRQRFDGDLGLVGETVWLSGQPVRVAGVLPARFSGVSAPSAPAVWAPMSMAPVLMADPDLLNPVAAVNASRVNVQMLGRLRDDTTLAGAQLELRAINARARAARVPGPREVTVHPARMLPAEVLCRWPGSPGSSWRFPGWCCS